MNTEQFKSTRVSEKPRTNLALTRKTIDTNIPSNDRYIYLEGIKFLRIEDQPSGKPTYISQYDDVLTNFHLAENYGNLALIAHNHLAGKYLYKLKLGNAVYLIDGKTRLEEYIITQIGRFRAIQPRNPNSLLEDLNGGDTYTAEEVFRQFYMGRHQVIFQTCIAVGDNKEWGRYFLMAELANK